MRSTISKHYDRAGDRMQSLRRICGWQGMSYGVENNFDSKDHAPVFGSRLAGAAG